jgi:hypothetical protein
MVRRKTRIAELDIAKLHALAKELGYWPASTNEESGERHRRLNASADYWLARSHRFDHPRRRAELKGPSTPGLFWRRIRPRGKRAFPLGPRARRQLAAATIEDELGAERF